MLRIHVVRVGGHRYYVDELVPGRAEGTLVSGERPGRWTGVGARSLGLDGVVDADSFGEVMAGRHPRSGQVLRTTTRGSAVAGYDLTFCAPKSVSLLATLAPREIAGHVGMGHDAAVAGAAGYLARSAVGVRRRQGGSVVRLAATGLVAGDFLHRTSRALDPHLHTHLVAANVAQGVDGAWSAVDSRRVFAHLRTAGSVYQAQLRFELSSRLGATWEMRANGFADVAGIDEGLRGLFSQRSAAIAEYVVGHPRTRGQYVRDGRQDGGDRTEAGWASPRMPTKGAFFATRPDKDRSRTVDSLVPEWRARAADFGYDLGSLSRVVGRGPRTADPAPSTLLDPARLEEGLRASAAADRTLARRDVVRMVAQASPGGAPARVVEAVAERVVCSSGRPSPGHSPGDELGRGGDQRGGEWSSGALHGRGAGEDRRGEPRWRAEDIRRVVESRGDELAAGLDFDVTPDRARVMNGARHMPTDMARDPARDRAFVDQHVGLADRGRSHGRDR